MKNYFAYCLLQYVHSQDLGEALNLGIICIFPHQNNVLFKYPRNLGRLHLLYRDFSENAVKTSLRKVHVKIRKINKLGDLFLNRTFTSPEQLQNHVRNYISNELLHKDIAPFFKISPVMLGMEYHQDAQKIAEDYFVNFFSHYKRHRDMRYDEHYILRNFQTVLDKRSDKILPLIRQKDRIRLKNEKIAMSFGLSWRDSSTNLIKPVSFDLLDKTSIQNKAAALFGKFYLIKDVAKTQNLRFDLIVAKPKDNFLADAYKAAIETLSACPVKLRIITEEKLSAYVEEVAKSYRL